MTTTRARFFLVLMLAAGMGVAGLCGDAPEATPKPAETATPKPTEATTPTPPESATPKPAEATTPKPAEAAAPKPTDLEAPKPAEVEAPKPAAVAKPRWMTEYEHEPSVTGIVTTTEFKGYRGLKTLDGETNGWAGVPPIWDEGGQPLMDPGFSVDIKQVYITNDMEHLYILLNCAPTIGERFKNQTLPGHLGDLYFDIDNNRDTGSRAEEVESFGYGDGYEGKVVIDLGVTTNSAGKKAPTVSYTIKQLDREGMQRVLAHLADYADITEATEPIWRQVARRLFLWGDVDGGKEESTHHGTKITFGEGGVEMALPLIMMRVNPGRAIRIMLVETANDYCLEGYSVGYYVGAYDEKGKPIGGPPPKPEKPVKKR